MTADVDRLYELVPVVYRMRDADQGYPLRALLRTIAEQLNVVEHDIAGLYENWFIETCEDWVVPYIGALIGYTPLGIGGVPSTTSRAETRERILVPRREVADTIRFRRRKGTLALLEDLAEAVAGWPAHAVEFYRLLAIAQNIDCLRMDRGEPENCATAMRSKHWVPRSTKSRVTSTSDARTSSHALGTANIPDVGVFLWRLKSLHDHDGTRISLQRGVVEQLSLQRARARRAALHQPARRRRGSRRCRCRSPAADSRRAKRANPSGTPSSGVPYYYGPGRSLDDLDGHARRYSGAGRADRVGRSARLELLPRTQRSRGRSACSDESCFHRCKVVPRSSACRTSTVSAPISAAASTNGCSSSRPPRSSTKLEPALRSRASAPLWRAGSTDAPADAVIEIVDSDLYAEPLAIDLAANQTLQLRGANGTRPVIQVRDPTT